VIDGVDQTDLLLGKTDQGARREYHYFCRGELQAYRHENWKLILPDRKKFYGYVKDRGGPSAELYDLRADIGETINVAEKHPEVVQRLLREARALPVPKVPYDPRIELRERTRRAAADAELHP
jgi:arylsulfatase A-like enzyme